MKNYLKIQSMGEIETEAFTLIGASSKREDASKIGYFGSGLKYSISALLRNKIDFKVFQGETEIKFDVVDKNFRNEIYKAISVNGQETSMTTTMGGADWDLPFAPIREIYSNALDEDEDAGLKRVSNLIGESGTTTIFIEMNENVNHFYENFDLYFCNKNPNVIHSNDQASIYPAIENDGVRYFRKGILCHHDEKEKSVFNYNSTHFEINESRVLNNHYHARAIIARGLKICTNESVIKTLITSLQGGNSGLMEHKLDWSWWQKFSDNWFNVCKNYKFIPAEMVMFAKPSQLEGRVILPKNLLIQLFRQFNDLDILGLSEKNEESSYIEDTTPSTILTDKVIDSLAILNETRYTHRLVNPVIVYANFCDKHTLGMADNGKIILSVKLESYDIHAISKIIIEENEHNKSGFDDETRAFQNHLFDLYYDQLISTK